MSVAKVATMNSKETAQKLCIPNSDLVGLRCLRCESVYPENDLRVDSGLGCIACLDQGFPSGLQCAYQPHSKLLIDSSKQGMFRYASKLPFFDFPTLGEGQTSLIPLPKMASELDVERIYVKNEGQNPTGSHKDRMSPLAVARAIATGHSKVIASSSGNAGASLSAYAARAGVECCIIASTDINPQWANAIKLTGAQLRLVESDQRWPLMQKMVQQEEWFPVTNFWPTPIGSNPFGIEGYKTIAYEIVQQLSESPPSIVIVPTCRGDLLFGIWQGFVEAHESGLVGALPRLVAVEPGARLERVLAGDDYRSVFPVPANNMTSIDGGTATYQSLMALRSSNGSSATVSASQALVAQKKFAECGLYVEVSSAAALAGLWLLQKQGMLKSSDRIILIATSHGYKEGCF
jgi:threonine synthase